MRKREKRQQQKKRLASSLVEQQVHIGCIHPSFTSHAPVSPSSPNSTKKKLQASRTFSNNERHLNAPRAEAIAYTYISSAKTTRTPKRAGQTGIHGNMTHRQPYRYHKKYNVMSFGVQPFDREDFIQQELHRLEQVRAERADSLNNQCTAAYMIVDSAHIFIIWERPQIVMGEEGGGGSFGGCKGPTPAAGMHDAGSSHYLLGVTMHPLCALSFSFFGNHAVRRDIFVQMLSVVVPNPSCMSETERFSR